MALALFERFDALDVVLLRHATAENDLGEGDESRALSSEGRKEAAQCGKLWALSEYRTDTPFHLICSSAKRTHMTALAIKENAGGCFSTPHCQDALYNASESEIFLSLQEAALSGCLHIAIVAHNPGISDACRNILTLCSESEIVANGRYLPLPPCHGMMFRIKHGVPKLIMPLMPSAML